ncbi:MAG: tetraacyldisaccharide 4'-kinase [Ginsengibacter sp.]
MLRSFRYILFPFSLLYGLVIWVRNFLFDKKYITSTSFNLPIICIGNLAIGGTGKTPMTEYLVRLLKDKFQVGVVSRGYKRKTRGYILATETTTAVDIGDEPLQIHNKFPDIAVAVSEERVVGVPQLLHDRPQTEVIILDDAFQHRQVRAGLNILLTEYNDLYTRDILLPAGDLRDLKSSSRRADIIIVTKCKSYLNEKERQKIAKEIRPLPHQQVYFTKIDYSIPFHLFSGEEKMLTQQNAVLLVCAIANPRPLKEMLTSFVSYYDELSFRDHHIFNTDDLNEIIKQFKKIDNPNKIILTTEKDAVRLKKFENELSSYPIYVLPMSHKFLFEEEDKFHQQVFDFIKEYPHTQLGATT